MASYQTKSAQPKRYLQTLFATPLYCTILDLNITNLKHFCEKTQKKDIGRIASNSGGYQSNNLSLDKGPLSPLIKEIETNANIFAQQFLNKKVTQKIESIWINSNLYKDTNRIHSHPGSAISGVYYVKTPSECGQIIFEHPAGRALEYYMESIDSLPGRRNELASEEYNSFNSFRTGLKPTENTLYLFPSWLMHYVESNMNKTEERISISFNISPSK